MQNVLDRIAKAKQAQVTLARTRRMNFALADDLTNAQNDLKNNLDSQRDIFNDLTIAWSTASNAVSDMFDLLERSENANDELLNLLTSSSDVLGEVESSADQLGISPSAISGFSETQSFFNVAMDYHETSKNTISMLNNISWDPRSPF